MRGEGREEKGGKEGRGGRRERRGGLSGNAAEEAFCLKSAPAHTYGTVTHVGKGRVSSGQPRPHLTGSGSKRPQNFGTLSAFIWIDPE